MSDAPDDLAELQRRLRDIQVSKRGRIRWNISKHTAEMALGALRGEPSSRPRKSGKARRRKRKKRLL